MFNIIIINIINIINTIINNFFKKILLLLKKTYRFDLNGKTKDYFLKIIIVIVIVILFIIVNIIYIINNKFEKKNITIRKKIVIRSHLGLAEDNRPKLLGT
jgi:hypothetical protein